MEKNGVSIKKRDFDCYIGSNYGIFCTFILAGMCSKYVYKDFVHSISSSNFILCYGFAFLNVLLSHANMLCFLHVVILFCILFLFVPYIKLSFIYYFQIIATLDVNFFSRWHLEHNKIV